MRTGLIPAGFAMVEALVALVLLSVALAGSAILLVQAVRHERAAGERSRALRHAASLADGLRALGRADGQLLQAVTDPGAAASCADYAEDCVAESQARLHIDRWQAAVVEDMPEGVAAGVSGTPGPTAAYVISVSWPAPGNATDNAVRLLVEP